MRTFSLPEVHNNPIFGGAESLCNQSSPMQWNKRYTPDFTFAANPTPGLGEKEEILETTEEHILPPWHVILYNDDVHTFDEVIIQLIKATGCSLTRAEELTWEVHLSGKATVYEGTIDECLRVSSILQEIQLITEIRG